MIEVNMYNAFLDIFLLLHCVYICLLPVFTCRKTIKLYFCQFLMYVCNFLKCIHHTINN